MPAESLLLRLVAVPPAALGAWAFVAAVVWLLRIRDPRLRAALWACAALDTALAIFGWNSAGFLVVRFALASRPAAWVAPAATWICAVWAVIGLALVVRRVVATWRAAASAERLHEIHPADRLAGAPPRMRVALPPGDGTPFVAGLLRPVVVVPRSFWDRLGPSERFAMLAHEAAHVRRRDPLLRLAVGVLADALWPALPLRWIAARLDESVELSADAAAVRRGASVVALARAVAALAPELGSAPAPAGALAFRGRGGPVARRLDALRRTTSRGVLGLQIGALVLLAPWNADAVGAPDLPKDATQSTVSVALCYRPNAVQAHLLATVFAGRPRG